MTRQSIAVGVLAPLFPPAFRGGGPIRSIQALVESSPPWATVHVVTSDRDLGALAPLEVSANRWIKRRGISVYYATMSAPMRLLKAMAALRRERPALLHMNSFFNPSVTAVPLMLWRLGFWRKPILLVAPRGEFGRAALGRHRFRKRLYMRMFRIIGGAGAVIWHSTAPHETEAIRSLWGSQARIVERENDTLLPLEALRPAARRSDEPVRLAFLGRLVEHKGLHVVLEALKGVEESLSLDIFGVPEDAQYHAQCVELTGALDGNVRVTFHDPVAPDLVRTTLSDFDGLLLPTAGENFGHVIAEALSASCFVAVTPYTPWNEVIAEGGGRIVNDRGVASWTTLLHDVASMDSAAIDSARRGAADAYEKWCARPRPPHVWASALNEAGCA